MTSKHRPMPHSVTHKYLQTIIRKVKDNNVLYSQQIKNQTVTRHLSPLWGMVLPDRFHSSTAEKGYWVIDDNDMDMGKDIKLSSKQVKCIAQIVPDEEKDGRARINLFYKYHALPSDKLIREENDTNSLIVPSNNSSRFNNNIDEGAIRRVMHKCLEKLSSQSNKNDSESKCSSNNSRFVLTFGSIDRNILPHVSAILESMKFRKLWNSPCGLWTFNDPIDNIALKEKNLSIKPLQIQHAEVINDNWEYKSNTSLPMIKEMINESNKRYGGCIGLFKTAKVGDREEEKLVAWICRYLEGALGMLWTQPDHRRRGYAALVVQAAVEDIKQRKRQPYCYIVDENSASQNLFMKLNWKRVCDADWVGFASVKGNVGDVTIKCVNKT